MKPLFLAAAVVAAPLQAAEVQFCWIGSAGYSLTGRMAFPDSLASADRITEADVTAFEIFGYRDGHAVGRWSLADLRAETAWNLNFLPREMRFATGGRSDSDDGQQWNANGDATDCGTPGFGFNVGATAQDLCIDGRFVIESGVAHDAPLLAQATGVPLSCAADAQLSLLRPSDQAATP
jgi:hypothetical protein